MESDRLAQIEGLLKDLYEQLYAQENAKVKAEDSEKMRIEQKIRDTWKEISKYDREYVQKLAQQVKRQDVPEKIAEIVVAELVDEIEILEPLAQQNEIKALLQQILTELNKPEAPAAAKLKMAIPIVPGFMSYELEGDTENILRRLFPPLTKAFNGLKLRGLQDPKK